MEFIADELELTRSLSCLRVPRRVQALNHHVSGPFTDVPKCAQVYGITRQLGLVIWNLSADSLIKSYYDMERRR